MSYVPDGWLDQIGDPDEKEAEAHDKLAALLSHDDEGPVAF